jgi:hypothetical protein
MLDARRRARIDNETQRGKRQQKMQEARSRQSSLLKPATLETAAIGQVTQKRQRPPSLAGLVPMNTYSMPVRDPGPGGGCC